MSSNPDVLLALRQAIKSKIPITYATSDDEPCSSLLTATHLVISPGYSLPKSTPTRYRKPGISTTSNPKDFFSVEAVYLAWLLQNAPGAEYMKQARECGLAVGFVSVTERKSVVDWLEGKITDHERIVPLVGQSSCARGTIAKLTVYLQQNRLPPQEPLPAPAALPFLQLPTSRTSLNRPHRLRNDDTSLMPRTSMS